MPVAGPLSGVTVLDLSRVLAGPWATQILADYGAEVIKVERPGRGDDTRHWGPPFLDNGDAAYFQSANRNKKSVTIDFTKTAGAAVVKKLAEKADIVVENFKKGGLKKYGLDYESLSRLNPRLVYCSITGFGQTGPLADRPGYDYLIQAMGGLMSVTGQPDGTPGAEPMKVGVAVADLFTGMNAATGILAALRQAEATGQGQHIDLSLFDSQLAMLANQATNYLVSGQSPRRLGNAHPNIVPYQVFATKDGHIVLAVGNDDQFAAFCFVAGLSELSSHPDYQTNKARVENREVLTSLMTPVMRERTTAEWQNVLDRANVPCGPINSVAEALESEQATAKNMILDHGQGCRTVAQPVRFNDGPGTPPPTLGQHTAEVLRDHLGLSADDFDVLRNAQAI